MACYAFSYIVPDFSAAGARRDVALQCPDAKEVELRELRREEGLIAYGDICRRHALRLYSQISVGDAWGFYMPDVHGGKKMQLRHLRRNAGDGASAYLPAAAFP